MRLPNRKPGKYTFPTFDPHITQSQFDAMQSKLEHLKKVARLKAIKETNLYAENGDFSENAEYQIAKERLRGMNRTIDELEYQLPRAIIIEKPPENSVVQMGHTVTVSTADNNEITWKILGPKESNPSAGIISYASPIGTALIGKSVADVATVQLADRTVKYTIKSIT
ncbi:MAG: GreA/GreB family elongation factor [bacterium]|nr:GreA/GreB family elongation factor [bacterium]